MAGKNFNNMGTDLLLKGFEVIDFHRTIWNAGKKVVTDSDILLWLDEDKGDPGSCDYAKGDS
jgi:hypothetical protein